MNTPILQVAGDPANPKFAQVYVGPPAFTETKALAAGTLLYAAPARAPLTEDQVWRNDELMAMNAKLGFSMVKLMGLVRAVERAHDIEVNP